jgi:heme oxygenase
VAALAQAYRPALDRLPVDEDTVQALVAEARWSFDQHRRLFTELAADDLQPA